MNIRIPLVFSLLFLLPACSAIGALFPDPDAQPPPEPAAQAQPVAQAPAEPADAWCQRVALNAKAEAIANGFDAATQDRMAVTSYSQCVQLGTH